MTQFRLVPLLRQAIAITVSAALIITTMPMQPAWAQLGSPAGGGGFGAFGNALNPQIGKQAEPERPAPPATPEPSAKESKPSATGSSASSAPARSTLVSVPSGFWIGVITENARESLEVTDVLAGCPAAHAGIKRSDRLTQLNGRPLRSLPPLLAAQIQAAKPDGKPFELTVDSAGGARTIPFAPAPAEAKPEGLEIEVAESDELGAELTVEDGALRIAEARAGGVISRANLRPGDAILHVDCQAVGDQQELEIALAELAAGERERITLGVERNSRGTALVTLVRASKRNAAASPEQEGTGEIAKEESASPSRAIKGLLAEFSTLAEEMDLRELNPEEIGPLVGDTPEALAEWVQQNIALVPYQGSLKGARGVLLDREGNTLDRALLLAEMLSSRGFHVRLARKDLSDEATLNELLAIARADATPIREWQQSGLITDQRVVDTVRHIIEGQANDLLQQLDSVRPSAASLAQSENGAALQALADYWWVQISSSDVWNDLHTVNLTSLPRNPTKTYLPHQLPRRLRHIVSVSLKIEVEGGEAPGTFSLIDFSAPAAELLGKTLRIAHLPLGTTRSNAANPSRTPMQQFRDARAWLPQLIVGEDVISKRFFTKDGRVLEATDANLRHYDDLVDCP
jgi:hypothetical protein